MFTDVIKILSKNSVIDTIVYNFLLKY